MNGWLILSVIFYPIALPLYFTWFLPLPINRLDRLSALAGGFIVLLVLWLYVLPRDLSWDFGPIALESRFALPLTAYLAGLVVAAVLMSWTRKQVNAA